MCSLQDRIDAVARYLLQRGISVIPINVKSKCPATQWKDLIDTPMLPEAWPGFVGDPRLNLGLLTGERSGYVVIDCDTAEAARHWYFHMPNTPLMTRTRRGMHFYYRHPGVYVKSGSKFKIPGTEFEYDVKGDRSYVLLPPSFLDGFQYSFVVCDRNFSAKLMPSGELPEFDMKWRPEHLAVQQSDKRVRDGVAYISQITAVSGEGGDRDTFRAACKLIESGMSEGEALAAMIEWNQTNADPQWTVSELLHKVRSAIEVCGKGVAA